MTTTSHPTSDREALSALFDGELAGDAARFALKRLDHDQDWRDSCERWQVVGDVLRGAANPRMPSTFAARVHDALRASAPAPVAKPASTRRWGTVALAASAAMVAFFLARLPHTADAPASAPTVASSAGNTAPARDMAATQPAARTPKVPTAPDQAGDPSAVQLVGASVALASATRQASQRRAPQRAQRNAAPPATVRSPVTADVVGADVVGADVVDIAVADVRPATPPNVLTTATPFDANAARPWPRAVLPQYSGSAALSADYVQAPSFYPFVPRVPADTAAPAANEDIAPQSP
ncbi:hypothetical protein LYSHEL_02220 [Lysobacter helvus]|uniref:Anti sigma-E protein RseA N-terminal domain-containing protein n=2 Tax=Lysobacteraceae TaxID=32033 RepID=A0ABM7Q1U8_9GAMM|nr:MULTISPECIES: RseA family anti-sigma factor [Lysobacter]BCT91198.1 hypothetical protein LYSCAS_02220 [Lysobacter caseinilyticus]BCT94351.1 hypothetical protein LYSHEL_02220 [Lysobacter helvus]